MLIDAKIVDILTFIGLICKYKSDGLKKGMSFFQHFSFYEQPKFYALLS